jgi:hypothetical protein
VDESKLSDELIARLSEDLFGSGRSALDAEFEEIEREEAAKRRKRLVIFAVAGLVAVIAAIAVVWWRFA